MDRSWFDAWTRRTFALAVGGAAVAALGLAPPRTATAKKRRCRKLRQACRPGNKKKRCCKKHDLVCGELLDLSGKHCCRPFRGLCADANECCGALVCDQITGLGPETRCCSAGDGFCTKTEDCCAGFACNTADQQCIEI